MRQLLNKRALIVLLEILTVILFLVLFWEPFNLSYLFTETHISGGDTISHPWISRSLKNLWHQGRFWGWNESWGAGFPFLYFYFYPVYILSNFINFLGFSEAVSFKLMVFFIISLLPISYYFSSRRWLSQPYAIALTAMGFFLFLDGDSSYYGGNLKSVLAGQMSHHLGLVCLICYLGFLLKRKVNTFLGVIFLSLSVLSHVYSGIYAILFTLIFWFIDIIKNKDFKVILKSLKGALVGVGLTAFFWAPLIFYRNATVTPINQWNVDWQEIIKILQFKNHWFFLIYTFATIGSFVNLFNKKSENRFFYFGILILAYGSVFIMPHLMNSPILHIRLVPQVFLIMILVGVSSLNDLNLKKGIHFSLAILISFSFMQINLKSTILDKVLPSKARNQFKDLPNWWRWNMSGIEQKPGIQDVFDLWEFMKNFPDNEGRFAFEYFNYNSFGSPRIFELTPFMTGKSVFESLLMESSVNYPASYYINYLVKTETWWPGFPIKTPQPDIRKAVKFFSLFNMKYFVAHSPQVRNIMSSLNKKIIYQNRSFIIYEMNPFTRIANVLEGDLPEYQFEKPLYASVENFPHSLETITKIIHGTRSFEFPDRRAQDLKPIHGYWLDQKQRYVVPETSATQEAPKRILFKISYFPNWKTNTGEEVQLVSPNLMMVETRSSRIEISYEIGWIEKLSLSLSIITLLGLIWCYGRKFNPFKRSY